MGHLTLHVITEEFSVCKLKDYSSIDISHPFVFTGVTDEENSLVCPTSIVPSDTIERNDAISTFNTDYILTKADDFSIALEALAAEGYEIN